MRKFGLEYIISLVKYIILTVVAALMLFPLVYAFFSAFKTNMELMAYPGKLLPLI